MQHLRTYTGRKRNSVMLHMTFSVSVTTGKTLRSILMHNCAIDQIFIDVLCVQDAMLLAPLLEHREEHR
jgi:hypothetical protein